MRRSASFTVEGVEPDDLAWQVASEAERRAFWRAVVAFVLRAKDEELAKGLDRYGKTLAPLSLGTIRHRKSAMGPADPKAPPLTPAYAVSRTRLNLTGRAYATHAQFFWTDGWGKILRIHASGSRRGLPKRDVIGLSPKSLRKVARQALAWWRSSRPSKLTYAAAMEARGLPVVGRTDYQNFTYGIGTGEGDQAAESRRLLAAGRATGFFQRRPGQGRTAMELDMTTGPDGEPRWTMRCPGYPDVTVTGDPAEDDEAEDDDTEPGAQGDGREKPPRMAGPAEAGETA